MPLVVNAEKCPAFKAKKLDLFTIGCHHMAIGLGEVTKKNLAHAQARIDFLNGLDSIRYGQWNLRYTAEDLLGATSNVSDESFAKWNKRMVEHFFRDRERANECAR